MNDDELKRAAQLVAEAMKEAYPPTPVVPTLVPQSKVEPIDGTRKLQAWLKLRTGMGLTGEEAEAVEGMKDHSEVFLVPRADITRGSQGAHIIPTTIADQVINELGTYSAVYRVSQVMRTATTENLKIPIVDDTGNAAMLVGTGVPMTSVDPAVSSVTLSCYTLCSKPVVVNRTVLRDSAVNLERILSQVLSDRIGRTANSYFTKGTGASEPRGLLASSGGVPTRVTTAASNAITFGEILALYFAVEEQFRTRGTWMGNTSTILYLRSLADNDGRPLLIENPVTGMPATIFGRPVVENPDMDAIAAGKKVLIFGDFSRYVIREIPQIRLKVLEERFAEYDAVGLMAFYDFDASLVATSNTKAIACLAMKP